MSVYSLEAIISLMISFLMEIEPEDVVPKNENATVPSVQLQEKTGYCILTALRVG
jgi:hypothetical protein